MEPLGQYLKRQREVREVTIARISDETKIAPNWVEAMEGDRWDTLPGHVFTRGFLRAYSHVLGLDAEEVLLRYEGMGEKADQTESTGRDKLARFNNRPLITTVVIILALILLIWYISSR